MGERTAGAEAPVPALAVVTALEHCEHYLRSLRHEDLDSETSELTSEERDELLQWHYKAVLDGVPVSSVESYRADIETVLSKLRACCTQFDIDGTHNVWIVKPGAKSRGRGIQCYNRLDDIMKLVGATAGMQKDGRYVVQKYIEKPLLIYNTKFDIRQWFVVTDWNPFTLWFYKDCYLRFCSQEYTLNKLDECIHLSNNSIQKNYRNGTRAEELPDDNMWHCDDFKLFLKDQGKPYTWDNVIYPGMKDAVINALLCCQDEVEQRKSTFELYGADFMLSEDCHPWLIEINSSPCMAASTKVTALMCKNVLEDTMRIVLDRRADRSVDTGLFELAYRQAPVSVPSYVGVNLVVEGQVVKKPGGDVKKQSLSDAGGGLRTGRPTNGVATHNKTRSIGVDEPCFSTHKIKPAECVTGDTHRAAMPTKSVQTKPAVSVTNKRHRKLDEAPATDSALTSIREKLDSIRTTEVVKERRKAQQKWTSVVVRRQRYSESGSRHNLVARRNSESSESDSEPARTWSRSKTKIDGPGDTKSLSTSQKGSAGAAPSRRRSSVANVITAGDSSTSGGKAHKATRPGAVKPHRHRRSKNSGDVERAAQPPRQVSDDTESATSDNAAEPTTSSADPVNNIASTSTSGASAFCRVQKMKPSAATCSVIFSHQDSTGSDAQSGTGRHRRRNRTPPTLHYHSRHPATISMKPCNQEVTTISVSVSTPPFPHTPSWTQLYAHHGAPRPSMDAVRRPQAPLPTMPSFGARPVGSSKRLVLPMDCWLRYSHDDGAGPFQFGTPGTRSMLMRDHDRKDLRASMQVIGLGNTARQQPLIFTNY